MKLPTRAVGSALLFLLASALVAGWSLRRAVVLDPLPIPAYSSQQRSVRSIAHRPATPTEVLVQTVLHDPFHPERRAGENRYRPGMDDPAPGEPVPPGAPATLQLLGTVVLPEGGLAMVERQGESRMVRVGESFAGFRLQRVERARAFFVAPGGASEVLEVERPGG